MALILLWTTNVLQFYPYIHMHKSHFYNCA